MSSATIPFGSRLTQLDLIYAKRGRGYNPSLASNPAIGENTFMELLVYSADWCRDCREAKRFLGKHAIPYTEINIEKTPGAADAVIAQTGKRGIPQFVLDGKWIQPYQPGRGFLHEEMAALFGVTV
jgi:mycoredoxin